jgi:hypothetical protein
MILAAIFGLVGISATPEAHKQIHAIYGVDYEVVSEYHHNPGGGIFAPHFGGDLVGIVKEPKPEPRVLQAQIVIDDPTPSTWK